MTQAELLEMVEASIIGNLQVFQELWQCTFVKAEYFAVEFRKIFEAMELSMKTNNCLISEQIFKYPGLDINLYMDCGTLAMNKDKQNHMRLQGFLVEKYKKRKIISLANDMSLGHIDLDTYITESHKVTKINVLTATKLTKEKIMSAITKKDQMLWFSRFQKFGSLAKIEQRDFVILAAKTGVGKTTVALNLAIDLARYYDIDYFNLEMPEHRLINRLTAINSNIAMTDLKKYDSLSTDLKDKVNESVNELSLKHIEIINGSQTIDTIRSYVASKESDTRHRVVMIDHIGLITCKQRSAYERMTEIAKELRMISMDYNCTVIGLCQLNRVDPKKEQPDLTMLRDSGEIEQSARKVTFVWETNGEYDLVIEKNDSGPKGMVGILFDKSTQRISESSEVIR